VNNARYTYDEESDTLSINFVPTEKATGIELTDHIILHVNKDAQRLVRITLLDYSLLVQQTSFGPRTFPLTGLAELSEENRDFILDLLQNRTVKEILHIAAYTPEDGQIVPIIQVQPVLAGTETS
jgi:Protein of unknown function (DUF2283)